MKKNLLGIQKGTYYGSFYNSIFISDLDDVGYIFSTEIMNDEWGKVSNSGEKCGICPLSTFIPVSIGG